MNNERIDSVAKSLFLQGADPETAYLEAGRLEAARTRYMRDKDTPKGLEKACRHEESLNMERMKGLKIVFMGGMRVAVAREEGE